MTLRTYRHAALLIVMVVIAAACAGETTDSTEGTPATGSTGNQPTTTAEPESPTTTGEDDDGGPLRVGLVLTSLTVSTINDIAIGAQQRANELGDVELLLAATSDTTEWLNNCERIVNSGIDVLAYSTIDAEGTRRCIEDTVDLGIPIICVLPCEPLGDRNVILTIDFRENGRLIGSWMGETLGSGEVGVIEGAPGDVAAADLVGGFGEGLAETCPGCEIVATAPGGFNREQAFDSALRVFTANPNIVGVYSLNDDGALGVVEAADQQGLGDQVVVAGHNGSCEAVQRIMNDDGLDFTVLLAGQPFGIQAVDTAIAMAAGDEVEEVVNLESIPLDAERIQMFLGGDLENPEGVDVVAFLENISANGC